jgi:acyl-CoA reductase-like NAD-dependent aldehyde dehydrogenase
VNGSTQRKARPFPSTVIICAILAKLEPSSAEIRGYMADFSREDFEKAIAIADKGFREYSTSTTFPERGAQLRRWFDLIHENIEDRRGR